MSEVKLEFVGKHVKDIYGTFMGRVVGIITDIDGSTESVGCDCGSSGLRQLPYEQLVIQGDYVIYIPRWRLDAQKLLRQKSLTLRRIKALQEIVTENDMKEDAELVYLKYEKRLHELEEIEKTVNEKIQTRLNEIDAETKNIKAVLFDAKLQFRANEMTEETFQQIKIHTDELVEHIVNEKTEIANVKAKLSLQTLESINPPTEAPVKAEPPSETAAPVSAEPIKVPVPQVVNEAKTEEKVATVTAEAAPDTTDPNWLNQVINK